jgi:hypothetical protein
MSHDNSLGDVQHPSVDAIAEMARISDVQDNKERGYMTLLIFPCDESETCTRPAPEILETLESWALNPNRASNA